ncbi:MAG: glutamine synthetase family protein [Pseudomonadota bacterium]
MLGNLTMAALQEAVSDGRIDTVLACIVDMQGRLMGKRLHAAHFCDGGHKESHCCDYLLATDLPMYTVEGFKSSSWDKGYGDYIMKPDLATLRLVPWLPGTALVLCDILDHHTHAPVPHAPRQMLKAQIARLEALGYTPCLATELEFFLFRSDPDSLRRAGYRPLETLSGVNEDYHILQTTKEETVLRPLRNGLYGAGIPVEGSKGEAETGQHELNIRYGEGVLAADYHTIAKHAAKECAFAAGHTATFIAKWRADKVGSATHIHQSLKGAEGPAFHDPSRRFGMSALMEAYMAGLIAYAPEIMVFCAPYVNSYKRFRKGTFAPTRAVWSVDNRTAAFRLVADGTPGVRVECRLGGADLNPYLAMAALLAAGAAGIEEGLSLGEPASGDAYEGTGAEVPLTLRDATNTLRGSTMLRAAFGDPVVDHYVRAAEWEQEAFDAAVTDWEIERGFELA